MSESKTHSYHFLTESTHVPDPSYQFEFDESDVWSVSISPDTRKPAPPSSRIPKRHSFVKREVHGHGTPASAPVSVPDWSKILKQDYNDNRRRDSDDDGDYDNDYSSGEEWIPPHEFLARTRIASFSVHEGIGRTLKGRDLRKVRNAIFAKTGFED